MRQRAGLLNALLFSAGAFKHVSGVMSAGCAGTAACRFDGSAEVVDRWHKIHVNLRNQSGADAVKEKIVRHEKNVEDDHLRMAEFRRVRKWRTGSRGVVPVKCAIPMRAHPQAHLWHAQDSMDEFHA